MELIIFIYEKDIPYIVYFNAECVQFGNLFTDIIIFGE